MFCSYADEINNRMHLNTPSSDERIVAILQGVGTIMDYNYTMKKYLADLSSEYSTEELSRILGLQLFFILEPWNLLDFKLESIRQELMAAAAILRIRVNVVAHNPLQFVAAHSAATALSEQAKQQLLITEQQKRIREELRKNMHSDEDETAWQSNLNSWLSKRKTAMSRWKEGLASSTHCSRFIL
ncbi:unnamed protein product, partial [Gongylonema pulchrum]|uniref:PCI domain-containing protein n=1 Tax=Gongylonema pulchrum TaxID=637853 RepID=A0A183CZP2_9BILA